MHTNPTLKFQLTRNPLKCCKTGEIFVWCHGGHSPWLCQIKIRVNFKILSTCRLIYSSNPTYAFLFLDSIFWLLWLGLVSVTECKGWSTQTVIPRKNWPWPRIYFVSFERTLNKVHIWKTWTKTVRTFFYSKHESVRIVSYFF